MNLSIIIPCFNEEKNLLLLINKLKNLKKIYPQIEIIMVDNGSIDQTNKILKQNNKENLYKITEVKVNKGYGFGIVEGLKSATSDFVGWIHADNINDFVFFKYIHDNNLLQSKNIFIKGLRGEKRFLVEYFFTFFLSIFSSIILRRKLNDINAQPTIFNRKLFTEMKNIPNDFTIDLYVFFFAIKNKQKIYRIKVINEKRLHGKSSWNNGIYSRIKLSLRYVYYILFEI